MKYQQIQSGDELKFFVRSLSGKKKEQDRQYFESEVISLYENERIFVMRPPSIQSIDILNRGGLLNFIAQTKEGAVSFDGIVIKTYREKGEYFMLVRVVSPVVKTQLRTYRRFNAELPIHFSVLQPGEDLLNEPDELLEGKTLDISGGGVKFLTSVPLEKKTKLRVIIEKKEGSVLAESVVIKQEQVSEDGELRYVTRVKFITLFENKRRTKRTPCNIPLQYATMTILDKYLPGIPIPNAKLKRGQIKDISRTGLRFLGDVELLENSRLNIVIEKPEKTLLAEGVVIQQKSLDTPEAGYSYETRVNFRSCISNNRKFVRYPCFFTIKFAVIHHEPESPYRRREPSYLEGKAIDISEGGTRFVSPYSLGAYTSLKIIIEKSDTTISAEAIVLQTSTASKKYKGLNYETRVKFTSVQTESK